MSAMDDPEAARRAAIRLPKVRLAYVRAFNEQMYKIWRERMALLKIIDTGALYRSVLPMRMLVNGDGSEFGMSWGFLEYGLFQDRGTGREVPIGNPGDIGRIKMRDRRPWMSKAFYTSTMNIKEFMAESLSKEAIAIISNALNGHPDS